MMNLLSFLCHIGPRLLQVASRYLPVALRLLPARNVPAAPGQRRPADPEAQLAATAAYVAEGQRRLEAFVAEHCDLRYNLLDDTPELRLKDASGAPAGGTFAPADRRSVNSLVMAARRAGLNCRERDVARVLRSDLATDYHPLRHYMASLPAWDGRDRVDQLARRVSDGALWVSGFHRWMLAMAAAWEGRPGCRANAVAPLLVSRRQGLGKSTFCRRLLPPQLAGRYADRLDLTALGRSGQRLASHALVNLDEFDRYGARQLALLKNLMQAEDLNERRPYSPRFEALVRTASFIGTSNAFDLLTDASGSRRFLCVEVCGEIDRSPVDHDQLYAQLHAELEAGARTWFTKDEEAAIERNNRRFYRTDPALEAFGKCFRPAAEGEEQGVLRLTATELFQQLRRRFPAAMRGVTPVALGRSLAATGAARQHAEHGNVYRVVRR